MNYHALKNVVFLVENYIICPQAAGRRNDHLTGN